MWLMLHENDGDILGATQHSLRLTHYNSTLAQFGSGCSWSKTNHSCSFGRIHVHPTKHCAPSPSDGATAQWASCWKIFSASFKVNSPNSQNKSPPSNIVKSHKLAPPNLFGHWTEESNGWKKSSTWKSLREHRISYPNTSIRGTCFRRPKS